MFLSCSTLGGLRSTASAELFLTDQIRTLTRVHDAGYSVVELYHGDHPRWVSDTMKVAVEDYHLRPYSIHLPKFLFTYEEERFNRTMEAVFRFVADVGIEVAVLHPPNEEQIAGDEWRGMMEGLLRGSEEAGCRLTFEIVPYLHSPQDFISDQIRYYEGRDLGVTVDIEFMHILGLDILRLWDMFGESIHNIHFRDSDGSLLDSDGKRKYLLPGTGRVDLRAVVRDLRSVGYSGAITVEVSHRNRENIVLAKEYAEWCISDEAEEKEEDPARSS
ncbi:MAG: sugar phosphate isomerase/epimerase [Candidatus Thorarchaeota archaeon]|nr:sugar phosphate isomerase/epimerase [Candidatus Thorarchaeota archaeon]